jgi:hypothetical protein
MEEIEGLPLVFNSQQDNMLLGKLFPEGFTFPKFPEPQVPIWKEEWKTRRNTTVFFSGSASHKEKWHCC